MMIDEFETLFEREVRCRIDDLERRAKEFIARTGLPVDQVVMIHYGDKVYFAWKGALVGRLFVVSMNSDHIPVQDPVSAELAAGRRPKWLKPV